MTRKLDVFAFDCRGSRLFGCYHRPLPPVRDLALLLCPSPGHEEIQFHRLLRQQASLLAEAGFTVLRFDPSGCGDAQGDESCWSLQRWRDDVAAATAELRRRSGVPRCGLLGLRLGGTLACQVAASSGDIDCLVLWDPVISGRRHLDELRGLQRQMLGQAHVLLQPPGPARPPATMDDGHEEILGYCLSPSFVADLQQLELLPLRRRPAGRVLLVESHPRVSQQSLAESLAARGADVVHERFENPHLWVWTEDFGKVHVPRRILDRAVQWLSEVCP